MHVKELVEQWLRLSGYDGLWNAAGECACDLEDLIPCGEDFANCTPGFKMPCPPGCAEHNFHIGSLEVLKKNIREGSHNGP